MRPIRREPCTGPGVATCMVRSHGLAFGLHRKRSAFFFGSWLGASLPPKSVTSGGLVFAVIYSRIPVTPVDRENLDGKVSIESTRGNHSPCLVPVERALSNELHRAIQVG